MPTFDGITWDPFTKQLLLTAEAKYPTGGVLGRRPRRAGRRQSTGRAVRLPRAGLWRLRGRPERLRRQRVARGGHRRRQRQRRQDAQQLRLPVPPIRHERPHPGGTLEALQVLRRDGSPITAAQLSADPASEGHRGPAHRGTSFATKWVTAHTGTRSRSTPPPAPRRQSATPFKRPENGVFRPGHRVRRVLLHRDRRHEHGQHAARGLRRGLPPRAGGPARRHGPAVAASWATGSTPASTTSPSPPRTGCSSSRTPATACTPSATRSTPATWSDVRGDDHKPRRLTRWLAEGRDASATFDAITSPVVQRRRQRDHRHPRLRRRPTVSGLLGAKLPQPFDGRWRMFWTQQHGDNVTWEITGDTRR